MQDSSSFDNSNSQCSNEANSQLSTKPRRPRRLFTRDEDHLLLKLVDKSIPHDWSIIAEQMPGRSTRQCKERYFTYLCPSVNKSPWTPKEDHLLLQKVNELGKRWSAISRYFDGRTANSIKNRYHLHIRCNHAYESHHNDITGIMSVEGDLKSTLKTNSTNDQIWSENGNNGYDNVNNIMESNRYNCGSDIHCINECNEVFSLGCIITGTNIASPPPMHLPPLILSDAKLKGGKITLPPLLLSM